MRYTGKEISKDELVLRQSLEAILKGLGFKLIELIVSRHKGSIQVRAVIYNGKSIGVDDCSKVHRALAPMLDLAFEGQEVYLEVSSPGTDRLIKDGSEFAYFLGEGQQPQGVRCYRTDISDWTAGILESADDKGIVIKTKDGQLRLGFDIIAKAKLTADIPAG